MLRGYNSMVEYLLCKQKVSSSSLDISNLS